MEKLEITGWALCAALVVLVWLNFLALACA